MLEQERTYKLEVEIYTTLEKQVDLVPPLDAMP
jgi:hypothetical protein